MEMFGTYQVAPNLLVIRTPDFCQLNCRYCFRQYNEKFQKFLYKPEQINDLLNHFPQVEAISFLGGEPLIFYNFIRQVILLTHNRIKKYYITTNSLLLNEEMIYLFTKYHCQINISLDGPKEINDYNRGEGTFDKVMEKIKLLKSNISPYYFWIISSTFDVHTIDKLFESYLFFREIKPKGLAINIDRAGKWTEEELNLIINQLSLIKNHYCNNEKVMKLLFERIIYNHILYNHVNNLILHPDGEILQGSLFSKDKITNINPIDTHIGYINELDKCRDWKMYYPTIERPCYNFDKDKCRNCKLGNRIFEKELDKYHGELFCAIYHGFIDNLKIEERS